MSNEIFLAGVITFVVAAVFVLVLNKLMGSHSTYRKERNPYRRWCTKCGQRQEYTQYAWGGDCWWEEMGEVKDADCPCHKDSEYRP